jgi:hypothetical protein
VVKGVTRDFKHGKVNSQYIYAVTLAKSGLNALYRLIGRSNDPGLIARNQFLDSACMIEVVMGNENAQQWPGDAFKGFNDHGRISGVDNPGTRCIVE